MSWFDSIVSAAETAAQRAKNAVDSILPDFGNLPIVSNPVVLMVKGSDALMKSAVAASNDFNIKAAGYEPFAKLPDGYVIDEQQSKDVQSHNIAALVADYVQATAGKVSDTVGSVVNALTPAPGSMPLWVKFTVAAAVVIGTAVALQSLVSGRNYAR